MLSDQGRWDGGGGRSCGARCASGEAPSYEWGAPFATALLGRNAVRAGRHAEGLELLEEAVAAAASLRAMSDAALVEGYLAEALAFAGEPDRALELADRLLPGSGRSAALLHRVRGFALSQLGRPEAAARPWRRPCPRPAPRAATTRSPSRCRRSRRLPGGPGPAAAGGAARDRGDVLLRRLAGRRAAEPAARAPGLRRRPTRAGGERAG